MLGDALGGIGGAIGGIASIFGAGGKGGIGDYKKAVDILQQLQTPNFDIANIPYEDLKVFAEYFPQVYQAVVPKEVQLAVESPAMRSSQVQNLAVLQDVAQHGQGLQDRLAAQQAGRAMQGELAGANQGVLREMAQRGRLGGGDEYTARLMNNQAMSELASQMGSRIAQDAMARRLQAAQAGGQLGGQIRGQDVSLSQANADAANRFNELVSGRQNEAAQYAAQMANQGNLYNTQQRQRIGEANVAGRQEQQRFNRGYANTMNQQAYENAYNKAAATSRALQGLGAAQNAERARKDELIVGTGEGIGRGIGGILDLGLYSGKSGKYRDWGF